MSAVGIDCGVRLRRLMCSRRRARRNDRSRLPSCGCDPSVSGGTFRVGLRDRCHETVTPKRGRQIVRAASGRNGSPDQVAPSGDPALTRLVVTLYADDIDVVDIGLLSSKPLVDAVNAEMAKFLAELGC